MKKLILFLLVCFAVIKSYAYTPLTLTGFNVDVIANGAGIPTGSVSSSVASSTTAFDGVGYLLVAQDYSYNGYTPTYYLPTTGIISSTQTTGLTFQLASYSATNTLLLSNYTTNTGTLTLSSPQASATLYLLGASGGIYPSTAPFTAVVNFSDGTTQSFTSSFADWFYGTPSTGGIGRIYIDGTPTGGGGAAPDAVNPHMFQIALNLSASNYTKIVNSVTVTRTGTTGTIGVFAITSAPPCTGTPTAATITPAGPLNLTVCSGAQTFTASGGSVGNGGITLQWQQSLDGGSSYSDITGATNATLIITPLQSMMLRVRDSCVVSNQRAFSASVTINVASMVYASLPYSESFESWVNLCSTSDVPEAQSWLNSAASTGNNSWRRDDQGSTASWTTPTGGAYTPAFTTGAHSARFHSYYATSGTAGNLDFFVDLSATNSKTITYDYRGTDGTSSLAVLISTDGQNFTQVDAVSANSTAWATRTITTSIIGAHSIIRFKATSDFNLAKDIGLDNVNIYVNTSCTGTPNITVYSDTTICPLTAYTLTSTVTLGVAGLSYQWYRAPVSSGVYQPIPGATTSVYNNTTGDSVSMFYRLLVTCTNSGLIDTTNYVTITMKSPILCYCTPTNSQACTANYISNVTFSSINNTTTCSESSTAPFTGTTYSTFNPTLSPGTSYTLSVTTHGINGALSDNAYAWLDMNGDGVFNNPPYATPPPPVAGERVLVGISPGSVANNIYTSTVTIPATNTYVGQAFLRVMAESRTNTQYVDPCTTLNTTGEVENYLVTIAPAAPVVTGNNVLCAGATLTLTATTPFTTGVIQWTKPDGTHTIGGTLTVSNITAAGAGVYSATVTYNSITSAAGTITVTVNPLPNIPVLTSNSPVCSGSTIMDTATNTTAGVTNIWTGPGGYYLPNNGTANPNIITRTNATTAMGGVYTDTVKTVAGCIAYASNSITVNQTPAIATVTGVSPTTCNGTNGYILLSGLLNNTPYNFTYTGTQGTTSGTSSLTTGIDTIKNLGAGTYGTITVSLNNCQSAAVGPVTLVNPALPATPTATSNSPVCSGNTLNLFGNDATSGVQYNWTGPVTIPAGTQNPVITNVTTAAAGTYSLTVTSPGTQCTSLPATTVVVVNPTPNAPTLTSNSPICSGTSIVVTATNTTTGVSNTFTGPTIPVTANGTVNPNILTLNNATVSMSGVYTDTVKTAAGCLAFGTTNVIVNQTPSIATVTGANPTTCNGTNGYILLSGLSANTTYAYTYNSGSGTATTSAAGVDTIKNLGAGTYSAISVTLNNCQSATVGPVTISNPALPATPTATSNSQVCSGGTLTLGELPLITGVGYNWTGPNGFSSNSANPSITNVTTAAAGTYTLTETSTTTLCTSLPATTVVVINPTPVITSVTSTNPTACAGSQGTITINGLTSGVTYGATFTGGSGSGSGTANGSGQLILTGFAAGTYSNFVVTLPANCPSAVYTGSVTLVDPAAPAAPAVTSNSPVCSGGTLNLFTPTATSVIYNWTGPVSIPANTQNPVIPNVTTAASGTYTLTETSTITQCTSLPATIVVVVNPTPVITSVTSTNPTTCGGTQGSIIISGLTNGASYNYHYNSTTSTTPATASGGQITINGLSAGTYNNIYVLSSPAGCPSATYSGTITLTDPALPATPTATSNSPVCSGNTLNLFTPAVTNVTYNWTGPVTIPANTQNPSITNVTTSASGTYTLTETSSITQCISLPATTVVVINPTPVITSVTSTNPTSCGGTQGTIIINGLTSGVNYVVTFTGVGSPGSGTANGSGQVVLSGFAAGTYNNFVVTSPANCPSASYSGAITLVDPNPPAIPVITSNSPLCSGSTLTITATDATTGVSFSWAGPNGFSQPSNNSNVTRPNAITGYSGTYTVTVSLNSCTSTNSITVEVDSTPVTPTITTNSPVCSGNTITLTGGDGTNLTGLSYGWTGPNGFTSPLQSPSITNAIVADGGTYNLIATLGNCTSAAATATVVVDSTPVQPTLTSNSPICSGNTLTVTGSDNTAAVTYTWTVPDGTVPDGTNPVTRANAITAYSGTYTAIAHLGICPSVPASIVVEVDSTPVAPVLSSNSPVCSGNTVNLTATDATTGVTFNWTNAGGTVINPTITNATVSASGTYTATATLGNCISAAATTVVVVDSTPVITGVTSANPTTCTGTDGAITLSGLTPGNTYTIDYTQGINNNSQTGITADNTGQVTLTGLPAGTYGSFIVVASTSCSSAVYSGPVSLVDPTPPATPATTNNGPVCSGNTLSLDAASATNGVSYIWSGPDGFTSHASDTTINNTIVANSGTYSVVATLNGCTSGPGTTVVVIDSTPHLTATSFNNPTSCQGSQGSITLSGLTTGTSYTIHYTSASGIDSLVSQIANGSGQITVIGLGAGAYNGFYVVNTATGCTSNTLGNIVTLSDPLPPAPPVLTSNSPVCSGTTLMLHASSTSTGVISYVWNGPNGFNNMAGQDQTINNATTAASGTYTATATLNNCTSLPNSKNIVVDSTPVITSVTHTDPSTCLGAQGTLTVSGGISGTTYVVTYTQGATNHTDTLTANNIGQVTVTGLTAGNYTNIIIRNAATGCTSLSNAGAMLTDPAPPAKPDAGADQTLCSGSTLTLTSSDATPSVSYMWNGPNGFISHSQDTTRTNALVSYSGNYIVKATLNNCSSYDTMAVVVDSTPITPIAGTQTSGTVCSGNIITLAVTSSNGATFSWTGPDGFTAHTGDTTISNAQAANAGAYTVTASNGVCTSAATTINIIVNPTPDAPIVRDTVYCLNSQAAPLSATPNTGINWYSATQQSLGGSYTPPTDVATTLTYYATQTVNGCTSFESLPLHVQVNPLPPMPDTVANAPLCQYGMMTDTLAANGLYSDSLRWYNAATGGISTTPPVPSTDESGYQYYYVTQTHLGCESPRASDIVYVTPKPAQPLVNPSYYTYCQGETAVRLSATPATGLTWYIGDTTMAGTLTPPVPSTNDSGIINYYVTETMNGCTSYASDIVVHTSARPVVVITSSKSYGCQFDTLTFSSSGSTPPGSLLSWTIPSNDVLISGDTTTNNPGSSIVVRFDSAGPQDIILTVSNGNACTSADTFSFNVVAPPVALQKVQGDACPGDVITVALSSVSSSVRNYDWSFGDAMVLSGAEGTGGPYKIAYSDPGVHFITLKVTSDAQCPSITMTDTVVVHANPEAVISSVSSNAICSGDSVKLGAKGFDAGYSYLWSPSPYFKDNSGTDVWAVVAQSGYLTLKVTSEYGCMAYDSTLVTTQPCCGVYFPNAFTPNGDRKNDEFGVVSKGHHKIHIFRIANRWGQTVFETADERQKWDGTFNGVAQEMGTYDYYIKYDCDNGSTLEQKGQVMLVR